MPEDVDEKCSGSKLVSNRHDGQSSIAKILHRSFRCREYGKDLRLSYRHSTIRRKKIVLKIDEQKRGILTDARIGTKTDYFAIKQLI